MIKVLPPKTAKEVVAREREEKARTTLLMALPEDHLAKFHKMADVKETWEAIKSRFGGNDESKKIQKYLLKVKGNQDSRRRDVGYNENKARDNGRRHAYQDDSKALVTIDGKDIDWSGHVKEDTQNYAMMAYSSINSGSDNESVFMNKERDLENTSVNDRYAEVMHAVPSPMTWNYMPFGPDVEIDYPKFTYGLKQTLADESDSKPSEYASCESDSSVKTSTSMPEQVENEQKDKEKPSFSFTDSIKYVKPSRENVKETGTPNHFPKIEKQGRNGHTRKGLGYAFTRKACFVYGNKAHLADYQEFKGGSVAFGGDFTELARMGYEKPPPKLMFYKVFFSAQWKFLIHTLVQCLSAKRTAWNEFSCSMVSAIICIATDDLSSHTNQYTSLALTQKVVANMRRVGKGFFGVKTPLFATMLVQPQAEVKEDEVEGRKDDDNVGIKDASATKPTMFDDEEVTMTMAQTLIKMKVEKARLFDEQMSKRLHDEEIEQAAAKKKQEKDDLEKAKVLQRQYVNKKENIDWKVVVEQISSLKNMIAYLKNMVGYKMEHFKGMTYDKRKRVVEEILLQESFKKLKAVEVSEAYQSFEDMLKGFDRDDQDALWRLVKEKFSTTMPTVDKEKSLWVELKRLFEPDTEDVLWKLQKYMHYLLKWKLHSNCRVHQVSSTMRRHDMFMLTEKNYPLSNGVMTQILSAKIQVEEDSDMARDLVMKIFMEANKPNSRSLDTSSK
nr:xylulose kinase-1 [Tanacetum cinerariifolium]